ncbi:MAG TPA: hypothetical protein VK483_11490 [Chitinophagaceae bacterium]|nr:hypothetical protein [Chitinophagaceae bacterium]
MKKFITLSVFAFIATIFLASCVKDSHYGGGINEGYWLSKERGEVVYSDSYCNYFVVETINGYSVVRSYGGYKPFEQSIVYGDLSYAGTREFYNRSTGVVFTATVTDYWLTYSEAQDALDYYCPLGKGLARTFSKADNGKGTQTFIPK